MTNILHTGHVMHVSPASIQTAASATIHRLQTEPPYALFREKRSAKRWSDKRLALVHVGGREFPGITGDLSLDGLRLGLACVAHQLRDEILVSIAFTNAVVEVTGRIRYARQRPWGCLVGVRFSGETQTLRQYLSRRYAN